MDIRSTPSRRLQAQYLVGYNLVCAVLWTAVLVRVILLVPLVGFENVQGGVGEFTKWTQTLALLEVGHSALGMIGQDSPSCLHAILKADCHPYPRQCPLPPAPNYHASLLSPPSHLGCRQPIPLRHGILSLLQFHAPRLVRHRGHTLQLLCLAPAGQWRTRVCHVAEI